MDLASAITAIAGAGGVLGLFSALADLFGSQRLTRSAVRLTELATTLESDPSARAAVGLALRYRTGALAARVTVQRKGWEPIVFILIALIAGVVGYFGLASAAVEAVRLTFALLCSAGAVGGAFSASTLELWHRRRIATVRWMDTTASWRDVEVALKWWA